MTKEIFCRYCREIKERYDDTEQCYDCVMQELIDAGYAPRTDAIVERPVVNAAVYVPADIEDKTMARENATMIGYEYNDGGRAAAGYRGSDDDCVIRAIAIHMGATADAYKTIRAAMLQECKNAGIARGIGTKRGEGRKQRRAIEALYARYGFRKVALGRGARPTWTEAYEQYGNCIVSTTKHVAAIQNGAVRDTFDGRVHHYNDIPTERKAMTIYARIA